MYMKVLSIWLSCMLQVDILCVLSILRCNLLQLSLSFVSFLITGIVSSLIRYHTVDKTRKFKENKIKCQPLVYP